MLVNYEKMSLSWKKSIFLYYKYCNLQHNYLINNKSMTTIKFKEDIRLENPNEVFTIDRFISVLKKNWYYSDIASQKDNFETETLEDFDFKEVDYTDLSIEQQKKYNLADKIPDSQLYNI